MELKTENNSLKGETRRKFLNFFVFFVVVIISSVFQVSAQQTSTGFYDDPELSLEEVISQYHRFMNDSFNDYTKKMMKGIEKDALDPNGQPLKNAKECLQNPENYSTFCVAAVLLGETENQNNKGYMNYRAALLKRRDQVFDTAQEKSAYIEAMTCLGIPSALCDKEKENEKIQAISQSQKVLEISARLDAIDHELSFAKQTLDKTLAAYDQLRLAWPMHKQYVKVFQALTTYRDKIVEIRDQTDTFPARFVDVSSPKCL